LVVVCPVVVSPVEGGKFAIIDGQHRATSAALMGFDSVPCQIVIAAREKQVAAFKAINGTTTPISQMALHAAALVAKRTMSRSRMGPRAPRWSSYVTRPRRTNRRRGKRWLSARSLGV
jgi:ParB-like chromosome segregation protein Spo0J